MVQIDSSLLFAILAIVLPWAAFITKVTFDNQAKLRLSEQSNEDFKNEFEKTCKDLTERFKEMKDDVKEDIQKLNQRMDIFFSKELEALKNIANK